MLPSAAEAMFPLGGAIQALGGVPWVLVGYAAFRTSTMAHIHPPPQYLVTTRMLEVGPQPFSEVAEGDTCGILHLDFGESSFHALG